MPDNISPITSQNYDGRIRNQNFYINLTPTDLGGSGLFDTFYRINLGAIKRVSTDGQPFIVTEGINTLEYWSRDNAGNQESIKTVTQIILDKTSPYELEDLSNLNGHTVSSSQQRLIQIHIKDSVLLNDFITLRFLREGLDTESQSLTLQLDVSGTDGIYSGLLNENPNIDNFDVTNVKYWIEGTDAAENIITIGGDELSPLTQYAIDDLSPIFLPVYEKISRIGQTTTVKNLNCANTYTNGQIIKIEISLQKSTFTISADLSNIDSNYVSGQEIVQNLGQGRYSIHHKISDTNSILISNVIIPIKAIADINHETIDVSFEVSISKIAVINSSPGNLETHAHIDEPLIIELNKNIINDGLLTGHIYITDENYNGVPFDTEIRSSTAVLTAINRLKPNHNYIIHINPDLSTTNGTIGHYSEIRFTTGPFFSPLIAPGYVLSNVHGHDLTINDSTLKISNQKSITILWPNIPNDIINGLDLRNTPIMLSDKDSATIWTDQIDEIFAQYETIITIENLIIENPQITSNNKRIFYGGLFDNHFLSTASFHNNTLTFTLNDLQSVFVSEAQIPKMVADGQKDFIRLAWCFPEQIDLGHVCLVRKQSGFPSSIFDGTNILCDTLQIWYDIALPNNVPQYYRLFVFDSQNRMYNFVIQQQSTPNPEYRISYEYGEFETKLFSKKILNGCEINPAFGEACAYTAKTCQNAVIDIANNGNFPHEAPIFTEYRLGKNSTDKTNTTAYQDANTIVIELNTDLAFELKNANRIFIVCETDTIIDTANNKSPIVLFMDSLCDINHKEFNLVNAKQQ